jgi:hypothetical protein
MTEIDFDPIARLSREARAMAVGIDRDAARYLVDTYYRWQRQRIALGNQVRTLENSGQPTGVLEHFGDQTATLERQMISSLLAWVEDRPEGKWALGQLGIGPVLAAGLSAHIDIRRSPTVGHIWRFAGLDPTLTWLGRDAATALVAEMFGTQRSFTPEDVATLAERVNRKAENLLKIIRDAPSDEDEDVALTEDEDEVFPRSRVIATLARRPYNASLKVLCWKIGDSFVKISNRPTDQQDHYGRVYRERKAQEVARNEAGAFATTATQTLATRRITDVALRRTYEEGKLPPGRLDLRARRVAVKLFLAHWHDVAYRAEFNTPPPAPYPIAHLGHTHYIPPFAPKQG